MLISSITARGLRLTTYWMNVPLSSENGPNDIACEHPITSVKKAVAALTSGTVMPVWSWPRRPGIESADTRIGDTPRASAEKASKNRCCVIVASFGLRFSNFQPEWISPAPPIGVRQPLGHGRDL